MPTTLPVTFYKTAAGSYSKFELLVYESQVRDWLQEWMKKNPNDADLRTVKDALANQDHQKMLDLFAGLGGCGQGDAIQVMVVDRTAKPIALPDIAATASTATATAAATARARVTLAAAKASFKVPDLLHVGSFGRAEYKEDLQEIADAVNEVFRAKVEQRLARRRMVAGFSRLEVSIVLAEKGLQLVYDLPTAGRELFGAPKVNGASSPRPAPRQRTVKKGSPPT